MRVRLGGDSDQGRPSPGRQVHGLVLAQSQRGRADRSRVRDVTGSPMHPGGVRTAGGTTHRRVEAVRESAKVLDDHGRFKDTASFTGSNGEATSTYVSDEGQDGGRGSEREGYGGVGATFNMKHALLTFVTEPRILMLVPTRMPITEQGCGWSCGSISATTPSLPCRRHGQ